MYLSKNLLAIFFMDFMAFLIVDAGEVWHTLSKQLRRRQSCQKAFYIYFDRRRSAVN